MGNQVVGIQLAEFAEVSPILGPGVYALVKRGVVIYVGKSRSLYARIYAHRTTAQRSAKGKSIPTWLPAKGFVFDQVFVRPCGIAELDRLEAEMIELYKPRFNQSLKTNRPVRAEVPLVINGITLTLNKPKPPTIARRV